MYLKVMGKLKKQIQQKTKKYQIHGIFNFKTKKLLYVNLDLDQTELEYGLGDYNETVCDIISFEVIFA
jgi:hypothetical protein